MTPTGPSGNGSRRRQAHPGDTAADGPGPRIGTLALCVDLTRASARPSTLSGTSRSQVAGQVFRKAWFTFPKFSLEPKGCGAPGGDSVGGVLGQPQVSLREPGSAPALFPTSPAVTSELGPSEDSDLELVPQGQARPRWF